MSKSLSWDTRGQLVYSPVGSDGGPSLTIYNGSIYAAWKGFGGDQQIYFSSFDGKFWAPQKPIPDAYSSIGPSMVVFRGRLWAVMKGRTDDERFWYTSFDGSSWGKCVSISYQWMDTTGVGGSLAVFNGLVYMAYKGMSGDDGIYFTNFDGSKWSEKTKILDPARTKLRPALAVWSDSSGYGQRLVLVWKESGEEETLWYSTFDGSVWAEQQPIPHAASADGPALAFYRGSIHAAWRGPRDDERIWGASFDGVSWTVPSNLPDNFASCLAPALVVFRDQLYAAFKGRQGDCRIWWTRTTPRLSRHAPIHYQRSPRRTSPPTYTTSATISLAG